MLLLWMGVWKSQSYKVLKWCAFSLKGMISALELQPHYNAFLLQAFLCSNESNFAKYGWASFKQTSTKAKSVYH